MFSQHDLMILRPELALVAYSCVVLLIDLYIPKGKKVITYFLAQFSVLLTLYWVSQSYNTGLGEAFSGQFIADNLSQSLKAIILLLTFFILLYSRRLCKEIDIPRGEFHLLVLLSCLGMMCLVSAKSLLILYLGLELMALPLYVLVSIHRENSLSVEAGMKYFVMGALASGFLLYGMSYLYGLTGTLLLNEISEAVKVMPENEVGLALLAMIFILAGLGFKFGLVPFHMWVPDVYQGAPVNVTLFISSAPKVAAFGMAFRLMHDMLGPLSDSWVQICLVLATLSLFLGNFVALRQNSIKRMLAYSTIAHVGFFFLGLSSAPVSGYSPALYYIVVYAITSAAAFGILVLLSHGSVVVDNINDLKGLSRRSPWLAFLMLLVTFSLAGVPPLVGFYAKLTIIQSLLNAQLIWAAVVAMAFSIVGAFYYLRIVRVMYFDEPELLTPVISGFDMRVVLSLHGIAILLLGLIPAPLFVYCQQALS